jgi:aminopeptidase N
MLPAMRTAFLVLTLGAVGACGSSTSTGPVTKQPAPPPAQPDVTQAPPASFTPPDLRLPTTAKPTRNTIELVLDPSSEDFSGTIAIDLDVGAPTPVLWLNAHEITVDEAVFTVGSERLAARVIPASGPNDMLGLVPQHALAPGAAKLAIKYRGKAHKDDGDGIYTVKEGEDWYAFTQFENTDARQAFPCFDEPSFKVPWQLSITTKKDLVVLANTPIQSETEAAGGMKTVKFAETKPLPSYLVAFAVGPFDSIEAGKTRAGGPIRIVFPRGRAADAAYPAEATKPLLDLLEDYFGMPYPYAKLDILAVPVFNAGAMENAGLITFRQAIVLTKPAEMTTGKKESYAITAAHEMAHMWFGDFVTMEWWDDIWLNESFASWMEAKLVDKWKPEWEIGVDMVGAKSGAMGQDSLDSARAIRQPIKTHDDITNAFDGITYEKGEAVLTMVEKWVGADAFQKGVRAYLAKHAWGNATYDGFVGAMSEASGQDMKPVFDSFVLQSGVPLVSFELSCAKGAAPKLALAQRRYVPTGSKIDPSRTWSVPVCVRWGAGKDTGKDCTMLKEAAGELALTAKTCPDWVLPNSDELGYYHMLPKGDLLTKLLAPKAQKAITLPERVGVLSDVNSLVGSGDVQNSVALGLVEQLSKEKSRHIVYESVGSVSGIDEMVPDALRPNYERLIKKLFRARAVELGWRSKPGEDENTKQLRPAMLQIVGGLGRDPQMIKQATELAWKWLDDHKAVEPELVGVALSIAARYGDQKLFDRMHADAKKATDRQDKSRLLGAMSDFIDPKIVNQAMTIAMTDEFELRDALGLLQGGLGERQTRETSYVFMRDHFDQVLNKLPVPYRPYMAFIFVPICDDSRKQEFDSFFRPKIEKLDGGPRVMEQALEALTLCSAQRKAQAPGVVAFLKKQ